MEAIFHAVLQGAKEVERRLERHAIGRELHESWRRSIRLRGIETFSCRSTVIEEFEFA